MSSDMATQISADVVRRLAVVTRVHREAQKGHYGAIIRFSGLFGSIKSKPLDASAQQVIGEIASLSAFALQFDTKLASESKKYWQRSGSKP
jgi:hypothetical protein